MRPCFIGCDIGTQGTKTAIYAAGAAAALAAGRELREVPVEEIRSLLRAQGAIVPEI